MFSIQVYSSSEALPDTLPEKQTLGINALKIAAGAFALMAVLLGIFGWPTSGRGVGYMSAMLVMASVIAIHGLWLLVHARSDRLTQPSPRSPTPLSKPAVPAAGFGKLVTRGSWNMDDDNANLVAAAKSIVLAEIACAAPTRNGFIAVGHSHVLSPELGALAILSGPDFNGGGIISTRVYAHPDWKGLRELPSFSAPPFRDKRSGHLPGFVPMDGNPHTHRYRLGAFARSLDARDIVHGQIRLDDGIPISKRALFIELLPLFASLKFWDLGAGKPVLYLPADLHSELLQIKDERSSC